MQPTWVVADSDTGGFVDVDGGLALFQVSSSDVTCFITWAPPKPHLHFVYQGPKAQKMNTAHWNWEPDLFIPGPQKFAPAIVQVYNFFFKFIFGCLCCSKGAL